MKKLVPLCYRIKGECKVKVDKIDNEEIFMHLNRDMIPGLMPYFAVSNYGRVYSQYTEQLKSTNINQYGYEMCTLYCRGGVNKPTGVHRLVKYGFEYFQGCNELPVNHIDGVPLNNYDTNLEWCTPMENTHHAIKMGLFKPRGEDNGSAKITEETVIKIADALITGLYTNQQIADMFGTTHNTVSHIKNKECWSYILQDYDFTINMKPKKLLNINQVCLICEYYQAHPLTHSNLMQYGREALEFIGVSDISEGLAKAAKLIYQRKYYTSISQQYNF